jgi:type VI secretion system protein ImpJ
MHNRPVNWTEGMFLRPQHFQSADRYWQEVIATSNQFDHAYHYGIISLEIVEAALANSQLEITSCKARFHDGTIVSFAVGQVDRVDLTNGLRGPDNLESVLSDRDHVTVYLAIPKLVEGRPNVSLPNNGSATRYVAFEVERDEESAGGNRQPIAFRDVNYRILLSTQDLQGYDCLPIVRLKKSPQTESLVIDPDYFPPCVSITAWPALHINILRTIFDKIGERVDKLTSQLVNRNISWSSQHPGDLEKMFLASVLNEALGTLSCLGFAQGVHPFLAYTALCQIIGRLSVLSSEKRSPEYPRYDHDNLAEIFKWALRTIENLIYQMPDELVEQRWFKGFGRRMQVAIDPKWFTREWNLYVAIRAVSKSVAECEQMIRAGNLDWRFGSIEEVDDIFRDRKQGVKLGRIKQTPSALADRGEWMFFSLVQENEYWQHVQLSNSLAIRIRDEQIYNLKDLENQREIILNIDGQYAAFEFALFAVRVRL